jgi:hypothetical protein
MGHHNAILIAFKSRKSRSVHLHGKVLNYLSKAAALPYH